MRWHQPDKYHIASHCGRYTVAKTHGPPGTRYSAWYIKRRPAQPLGTFDNLEAARNACEQHVNEEGMK